MESKPKQNDSPIYWLFQLVSGQKKRLIASMILAVLYSSLSVVPYIAVYMLVDGFISNTINLQTDVWYYIGLAGAALIAKLVLQLFSGLLSHKAAFQLLFDVRRQLVSSVGKLTLGESNKLASASLKKIIADDVERLETFIAHHMPDMAASIITPIITTLVLLFIDWRLALCVLIPLPIAIVLQLKMFSGFNQRVEEYHRVLAQLHITVVDFVKSIAVVKAFNMTVSSHSKYRKAVDDHHNLVKQWLLETQTPASLFKVSLDTGLVCLLPVGALLVANQSLDIATLFIFLLLGAGLMEPLFNLIQFGGMFSEMLKAVESINSFIAKEAQSEGEAWQEVTSTDVEFDHVDYAIDHQHAILKQLTFKAETGQITAIVGPSGAGKTTAAQMIPRFFDYQSGAIRIGGIELNKFPLSQLMSQVSFVFQDVFIFDQTVAENILMGNSKLTQQEIEQAAKAACAHEFIMQLADGYQTLIKQGSLSGGQAQRLAIARAIAKDAPILILDEATAYADARNEVRIQQALSKLMHGKTVLVIAHRLNTLTEVNKIVVMDQGSKVAEGTHQRLLTYCSVYRNMWQAHLHSKNWHLSADSEPLAEQAHLSSQVTAEV